MTQRERWMRSATQGWRSAGVVVVALLAVSSGAAGGTSSLSFVSTTVGSHGSMGTYSGSLNWSWTTGTSGTLEVKLKNTSASSVGGFLTAFALGGPVGSGWSYQLVSTPSSFSYLLGGTAPATVDADPFGKYALGASTTNAWLGGGQPAGLAPGEEGSFVFTLTALSDATSPLLSALTASDFWGDPVDPSQGIGSWGFVARFRGIGPNGEDSDKSPAMQSLVVIPIPAPALLAGLGLIGAVAARRRFTRN